MRAYSVVVEEIKAAMNQADESSRIADQKGNTTLAQYFLGKYRGYAGALTILEKKRGKGVDEKLNP